MLKEKDFLVKDAINMALYGSEEERQTYLEDVKRILEKTTETRKAAKDIESCERIIRLYRLKYVVFMAVSKKRKEILEVL